MGAASWAMSFVGWVLVAVGGAGDGVVAVPVGEVDAERFCDAFVDGVEVGAVGAQLVRAYTKGTDDEDSIVLTSLLHWKGDASSITNADLDRIFIETFRRQEEKAWGSPGDSVIDLLIQQAAQALMADEGVNFENKIVLLRPVNGSRPRSATTLRDPHPFLAVEYCSSETIPLARKSSNRTPPSPVMSQDIGIA